VIVVSNTSPLMNLALIGEPDILSRLYGKVVIPDGVLQELCAVGVPGFALDPVSHPTWIGVVCVSNQPLVASLRLELDIGEAEAIALAVELAADLVLLDERKARRVAKRMGLERVGLLGVLLEAKGRGIVSEVRPILDDLVAKAGFWLGSDLRNHILARAGE